MQLDLIGLLKSTSLWTAFLLGTEVLIFFTIIIIIIVILHVHVKTDGLELVSRRGYNVFEFAEIKEEHLQAVDWVLWSFCDNLNLSV